MQIKDIMSREVKSLNLEDTIERAAQLMDQEDVGSIPICNQDKVVGIVTDRDIALRSVGAGWDASQRKVKDIMTGNPVTGTPEMDVHAAAQLMSEHQIRRLPIQDENRLVGVVALGDISLEPTLSDNAENTLKNISIPKKHHN